MRKNQVEKNRIRCLFSQFKSHPIPLPSVSVRSHVVVEPTPPEVAGEGGRATARCGKVLDAGARPNESGVRNQAFWPNLFRRVEHRSTVDRLVRETLPGQHQGCPSPDDAIHRAQGGKGGTGRGSDQRAGAESAAPPDSRTCSQDEAETQ